MIGFSTTIAGLVALAVAVTLLVSIILFGSEISCLTLISDTLCPPVVVPSAFQVSGAEASGLYACEFD